MSVQGLFLSDENLGLATDLYQLTMAAGYHVNELDHESTFELFVRSLPASRGYLVAAGLEQALHYLTRLRFPPETIAFLRGQPSFRDIPDSFFERLAELRFSGSVRALPEGTPFFPNEPVLQVTAPVIEAQLVETYLLTVINYQTLVATKASRICRAAAGRVVADFGTRRGHGPQAGLYAARAGYIGGVAATSNVLAGQQLGLPIVGTAAHSWTMAFDDEMSSFEAYHKAFPEHSTLLVDTYDTIEGTRRAIRIGDKLRGVRLDSGDLGALSRQVRRLLDEAGLTDCRIVASGDLNEYKITELLEQGAPIDIFGVGTEMITSRDEPALGGVYKLVSQTGVDGVELARVKRSSGKETYAGRKQVHRKRSGGQASGDLIALADESAAGEPLLVPVMENGALITPLPTLAEARERCARLVGELPDSVLKLDSPWPYDVQVSSAVQKLTSDVVARMKS